MAKVERGVVKPPNQELQGLAATRSQAPRAGGPAARGSNSSILAGDPGGSADLTRLPSPVPPMSHRFNVDDAKMPQPPAAIEPGKGAVPVNPFLASGPGIARATSSPTTPRDAERWSHSGTPATPTHSRSASDPHEQSSRTDQSRLCDR